jgi:hypothetical protein
VGRIITVAAVPFPGLWVPFPPPAPPTPVEEPTPCVPPGNRDYFKPNKSVTRAQVAKMIALAVGLEPADPAAQTFEDVPAGSTFHAYVEALAQEGIVNGYDCTRK